MAVIEFFMPMVPPTVTHQEHKVMVRNGRPVFYDPAPLKDARQKLTAHLGRHTPPEPMAGALRLTTKWIWPDKHPGAELYRYRATKPDTDNLVKLLKDCMTRCRYWGDDAQVASEITEKFFGPQPGIYVRIEEIGP